MSPEDVPASPGVYLFKDGKGRIVYIGKADCLRIRVRSYSSSTPPTDPRLARLRRAIASMEYIVTPSPVDALILEANLVREHKPRYNINLKDDKRYPYLKLTTSQTFPRLVLTRKFRRDGSAYFGPFTRVKALRRTMRLLKRLFPLRQCPDNQFAAAKRPCLNYELGRCLAPCSRPDVAVDYAEVVRAAREFLEGKTSKVADTLARRMETLAAQLRFEEAASARDQLKALQSTAQRQTVVFADRRDRDFVAVASERSDACGVVLEVREGKLIGKQVCELSHAQRQDDPALLTAFLTQYYLSAAYLPNDVCLPARLDGTETMQAWLSSKKGNRVRILAPASGKSRELVAMAIRNARLALEDIKLKKSSWARRPPSSLHELKSLLHLPAVPRRIEAYDVSNIHGSDAVGSMVAMVDGRPRRSQYKRFRVKRVKGIDDYAMMSEIVSRRLGRREEWPLPQLIVIDGGSTHASAAAAVVAESGTEIPVFGLAKRMDELFEPGGDHALMIPRTSPALNLLKQLRDEAHRFAVSYHRTLRRKGVKRSILERIPGLGPTKARSLLRQLGGLGAIREASLEDLQRAKGIGPSLARRITNFFLKEGA